MTDQKLPAILLEADRRDCHETCPINMPVGFNFAKGMTPVGSSDIFAEQKQEMKETGIEMAHKARASY